MWDECFLFTLEKQRKKRKKIGKEIRRKPNQAVFTSNSSEKDLQSIENGGTSRARTCDPVIMSSQIASSDYAHFYHKNRKCGTNV